MLCKIFLIKTERDLIPRCFLFGKEEVDSFLVICLPLPPFFKGLRREIAAEKEGAKEAKNYTSRGFVSSPILKRRKKQISEIFSPLTSGKRSEVREITGSTRGEKNASFLIDCSHEMCFFGIRNIFGSFFSGVQRCLGDQVGCCKFKGGRDSTRGGRGGSRLQ